MKYEYMWQKFDYQDLGEMNRVGGEGWEAVGLAVGDLCFNHAALMKRSVPEPVKTFPMTGKIFFNPLDGYAEPLSLAGQCEAEGWRPESEAPENTAVWTWREGEVGYIKSWLRVVNGDREWIEDGPGGRTTVTHHTFLPPTHWRPL